MKIINENLKDYKGTITIKPENADDLWYLMEIIVPGDRLYGRTTRKIRLQTRDGITQKVIRKSISLGIKVEKVSLQTFPLILRISGTIIKGPEDIPLGSHHTISVRENDVITIEKDLWPKFILDRIKKIVDATHLPNILLVSIDEGDAAFGLISSSRINILGKIKVSIPGKRFSPKDHETSMNEFFGRVFKTLKEYNERYNPEKIIIVGPGFVKSHFKSFIENRDAEIAKKILVETTSGAGEGGIYEAIRRGILDKVSKDLQIVKDNNLVDDFIVRLAKNDKMVAYGIDFVEKAANYSAISKLLFINTIFHEENIDKRNKIYNIIKKVEQTGGEIHIIDSDSEAGLKLKGFGGIVAILRFPLEN
ncbi:MAG: mRNA surveillance protein pelota [Spirochaetes bacterium]|nr:MAG: mRNA surveillance protein pelota [Spirochaetota bacterium]